MSEQTLASPGSRLDIQRGAKVGSVVEGHSREGDLRPVRRPPRLADLPQPVRALAYERALVAPGGVGDHDRRRQARVGQLRAGEGKPSPVG